MDWGKLQKHVWIAHIPARIRNRQVPNTSPETYSYTKLLGKMWKYTTPQVSADQTLLARAIGYCPYNFKFASNFKKNAENPRILMCLLTNSFCFANGKYFSTLETEFLSMMMD
jgi:hypothetical protein